MFQINELSKHTGVPRKTIRYYEDVGLLISPLRASNNYRLYDEQDIERLRFIRSARSLDFSIEEIAKVLSTLDRHEPPCNHVVELLQKHLSEIEARIRDLEKLREELTQLYETGKDLPEDIQMQSCVCHLIKVRK
jgi:DNA-binding transcriptional MerR regulator